jgi:hypothetical protein
MEKYSKRLNIIYLSFCYISILNNTYWPKKRLLIVLMKNKRKLKGRLNL